MEEITLHLIPKLDYLRLATGLSRQVCSIIQGKKIDPHFVDAVELAVSEACTNAIKHAGKGEIVLAFQVFGEGLVVQVKDQGKGFDLDKVPPPDFDNHPEGGYGIYIIKSKMDEVKYIRAKNWNILSMTKYF